jgi:hypothetical protein
VAAQQWIDVELLQEKIRAVLAGKVFKKLAPTKNADVSMRIGVAGVFLIPMTDDPKLARKISIANMNISFALGVKTLPPEQQSKKGRPCPKCGGVFRTSGIGKGKSELVCMNPKCKFSVLETQGKGRVIHTDWATGKPVKL